MLRANALTILICLVAGLAQASAQEPALAAGPTNSSETNNRAALDSSSEIEELPGKELPDPTAGKIVRYAENLIRKHDANGNGVLDEQEWRGVGGNPLEADLNQDGTITPEELIHRIVVYGRHRSLRLVHPGAQGRGGLVGREANSSAEAVAAGPNPANPGVQSYDDEPLAGTDAATAEAGAEVTAEKAREQARRSRKFFIPRERLPAGIASWFIDRDADGDGQITMREFSATWSADVAAQFSAYDRNRDGVITAAESVSGGSKTKAAEPADPTSTTESAPRVPN